MKEIEATAETADEAPMLMRIDQDEDGPGVFEGCGTACHPTGRCRPKS